MNSHDMVDEIKSKLDIVDVIGEEIELHDEGGGQFVGSVLPVGHSGKSLKVDRNLQVWHDMKNGNGGDVLDWIGRRFSDPRGSDFPEVLRIAANMTGVEFEEMTEGERSTAKEKTDIHNLLTEAAEIYHNNLTPELYDYIFKKWGIAPEEVDRLKIGYAKNGRNLENLDETILKKSGLVYVNKGIIGGEVFRGRIMFPYWKSGKVVYLIGRETEETPESERGKGMKYKKLLVYKEGHEYVSPAVQNSYFYGEDSLRDSDYSIITEGVADCVALLQDGFPCISPVTVQFRDEDHPKLIELTKGLKHVYICNDNEENEAGIKGALKTAKALEQAGIEAMIIELPRPEGIDKIDIAEYMKTHTSNDFQGLMNSSVRLCYYQLNKLNVSSTAQILERLTAFKKFISVDLCHMQNNEWEVFVNNDVAKKCNLNKNDIKKTVDDVLKVRHKSTIPEAKEKQEKAEDPLDKYPGPIREAAYKILREGDSFNFIMDTWNLRHVGDRNIGENCLCAVASTYILNTRGLHVKPSGESGKGKSDAIDIFLKLLPTHKYISGSMSSKSLYYHPNLKSGTIIYCDDANFTDDTIATLKQSTSNFQESTKHRTVVNQEYAEFSIPERCSFWFSTIDSIPDTQLANRFLNADVDGGREQDKNVYNHFKDSELDLNLPIDDDILICQCIFDILDKERYIIKIPYIKAIEWTNIENRRNFPKFLDILRSVTLFNILQRENINGYYLSNVEDFGRALSIYKGTSKNNATNLSDLEIKVLKYMEGKQVTIKDLTDYLKVSRTRVMQILHGKDGKGGMLEKVPQLNKINLSETTGRDGEDRVTIRVNVYEYTGSKLGLEIYDSVATLNHERVEAEETEFIKKLSEASVTSVIQCNPSVTPRMVTLKTATIDRINNSVTLKGNNVIGCNTSFQGFTDEEKNNSVSHSEKLGYRVTLEGKMTQPIAIEGCNPNVEDGVTLGYTLSDDADYGGYMPSGNVSAEDSCSSLLRKALKNYALSEFNGVVENIPAFVDKFNERTPEFKQRLGLPAVLSNAEKLRARGWK